MAESITEVYGIKEGFFLENKSTLPNISNVYQIISQANKRCLAMLDI